MAALKLINYIIALIFFICYSYQFFYVPVGLFRRPERRGEYRLHDYAVLICACNEEAVIGDLIASLRRQTYPQAKLHVFIMADNCTDKTAAAARHAGAAVYERFDRTRVGKGYALSALMEHLRRDYPAGFDGYFVFDADNLLAPDYIEEMNRTFSEGHDIVTSYRNSKNYGDNWISAGYALWFLRESRYLNGARHALGASCAVSGTGFMFSRAVAEDMGSWRYHTLTEDIEFTVHQIVSGRKIAYCASAELFDEQPTGFVQSWHQRMRWSKGYLQVFRKYGSKLLRGILRGSFSCYDMSMAIMPAFVLSTVSIAVNLTLGVVGSVRGEDISVLFRSIAQTLGNMSLTLFVLGAITTATEWRHIHTTAAKKIFYAFTFPLFMSTYIPIAVASLFSKPQWKHISHTVSLSDIRRRAGSETLPL